MCSLCKYFLPLITCCSILQEYAAQRLSRMKQREADCRRANEYLGLIPPKVWGTKVLKSFTIKDDYAQIDKTVNSKDKDCAAVNSKNKGEDKAMNANDKGEDKTK